MNGSYGSVLAVSWVRSARSAKRSIEKTKAATAPAVRSSMRTLSVSSAAALRRSRTDRSVWPKTEDPPFVAKTSRTRGTRVARIIACWLNANQSVGRYRALFFAPGLPHSAPALAMDG